MEKVLLITACVLVAFITNFAISRASENSSESKKILVVYYSYTGNTREVANQIKDITGGDILEIVPVEPYTKDMKILPDQVEKEVKGKYKPAIKTKIDNLDSYDIIFVGSPNWHSTIAPPVASFLSQNDLSGKTIIPFMTHGSTGLGDSESYIRELCPNSKMLKGLPVQAKVIQQSKHEVEEWLNSLGMAK